MSTKDRMVWIDFETDGLDPNAGNVPLELGMRITLFSDPRVIVARQSLLLYQPGVTEAAIRRLEFPNDDQQIVAEMHRRSGLTADLKNPLLRANKIVTATYAEAQQRFVTMIHENECEKEPLCGSSVDFDRGFLAAYFPMLANLFHYRVIDISTIKMMALKSGFDARKLPFPKKMHRPDPDIGDTIEEMLVYRQEGLCP